MAIKLPFKLNAKTIALVVSLLLNLLGGTGTIEPLLDEPDAICPPQPLPPAILPPDGPAAN